MTELVPTQRSIPLADKVRIRPDKTGLEILGDLSETEAVDAFHQLYQVQRTAAWAVGDLYNWCGSKWSHGRAAALAEAGGYAKKTVREYGSIAARYEPSIRMDTLSFGAHQHAAPLLPSQRAELLEEAAQEGWTAKQVLNAVRELKGLAAPEPENTVEASTLEGPRQPDAVRQFETAYFALMQLSGTLGSGMTEAANLDPADPAQKRRREGILKSVARERQAWIGDRDWAPQIDRARRVLDQFEHVVHGQDAD